MVVTAGVRTGTANRAALSAVVPLALAQLIIALDIYIVFVALPEIGSSLRFSDQTLQWVISGYAIAFGGLLMLGGRIADVMGRRRTFFLALGIYAGSSAVGGMAVNQAMLVAARGLQGAGGALLFPATLALVNTLYAEGSERNRALALWSAGGATGLTLGSLLGGVLTGLLGWRAVFFVNVPLAGMIALLGLRLIPAGADEAGPRARFDIRGALSGTTGIAGIVFALVDGPSLGWTAIPVVIGAVLGLMLILGFLWTQSHVDAPLMPPRLLRNANLLRGALTAAAFGGTLGALPYFLTLLFQRVQHLDALQAGLGFVPFAITIAVGTQFGGRMTTRAGASRTLAIGLAAASFGTALIAAGISATADYWELLPGLTIMGLGQGTAWTALWITVASGVRSTEQGVASGMASTAQQLGYAVGLAVLVVVASAGGRAGAEAHRRLVLADQTRAAVIIIAAAILVTALALVIGRRRVHDDGPQTARNA